MAAPRHKEHIKADIRQRFGTLVEFERRRGLPAGSVKDVLRRRSVSQTEKAIANELGLPLHQLFPWRYAPEADAPSTKEDSAAKAATHCQNRRAS